MKKLVLLSFLMVYISINAKNKTWTCINEDGQVQFTIEAINVYDFHSGLARVYKNTLVNNKWITGYGFIDKTGKVVIECNLDKANDFEGSVTWVKFKNQDYFTLINKKGTIIPTKNYKKTGSFYSIDPSVSAVYENDKMGFIDTTGKEIIPCKYLGASSFNEGLANVCDYNSIKGEYGYINKNGEEVIPLKFVQAGQSSFNNGLARASVQGKTVLIDKKGAVAFKTAKGNIQGHNLGLILVFTKPVRKGWGWINFKDQFVIKPEYDHAENFSDEGYAIVERNGLVALIDTTGKTIIDFKYETIYADYAKDGYYMGVYPNKEATSMLNSKKDYYNADFLLINTDNIKYIYSADGGELVPFLAANDKTGFLNRQFKIVIQPVYAKARAFSEGVAWVLKE